MVCIKLIALCRYVYTLNEGARLLSAISMMPLLLTEMPPIVIDLKTGENGLVLVRKLAGYLKR